MKRKVNIARIVWVVCLFLLLIVILLMVMDYKINYEYLSKYYLYFYECDEEVCVTQIKDNDKKLLSELDCGYQRCPDFRKTISDEYALLESNTNNILYNYKKSRIISDAYDDYEIIDSKYIIVKKDDVYGIIDINNKEIVKPTYDEIGIRVNNYLSGYNAIAIIAKKNDKYGLISYKDGKLIEEFKYTGETLEELQNILKKD